ncbi:hypothetical protein ACFPZ0_01740 [Streptomonospora nanhaiensis]|uniref:MmyB family transcriptional regulator n=1 Tax=Streptomonospora nanhaiensis TaxID=1323731 RepID=UPI0015CCF217|nr:hypothetical protein [Streptomonospora nanhaiensis]
MEDRRRAEHRPGAGGHGIAAGGGEAATPAAPRPRGPGEPLDRAGVRRHPASILDLLRRLPNAAAIVLSATGEVLAWNDLAAALLGDFSALDRRERNLLRRVFLAPRGKAPLLHSPSDAEAFAAAAVRHLRAAAARYPGDAEVSALVDDLLAGSAEFARQWAAHDVCAEPTLRKTVDHPLVGPITLDCDVLDIADRDQRVVIYTAEPGSPAEEALRLLSVVGTQRMDVPG